MLKTQKQQKQFIGVR